MKRLLLTGVIGLCFATMVQAECLSPGDYLAIHGTLRQVTYTGDAPGQKWVLFTEAKNEDVCANGAPEGDRTKIQLVVDDAKASALNGKDVFAIGHLFYSTKTSEHTPLLLDVKDLTTEDPNAPPPASSTPPAPATKKNSIKLDPGQMTAETACKVYIGMVDQTYMYVNSKQNTYGVNAVKLAEALYLAPEYIDFMVNSMQTNRRDYANGQYIHSLLQSNDQKDMAIMGCMMNPSQTIPNWDALIQHDIIVTTN